MDATSAASFSTRWRPQIVAGNIVSVTGVDRYVNARIALQDSRCAGAVLQRSDSGHASLYILKRDDRKQLHISCILWHPHKRMLMDMIHLRKWHEQRFHDDLYGWSLKDAVERDLWELTSYDA